MNLRFARLTQGLTPRELAAKVGVTRRTISHWELGEYPIQEY